MAQTWPPGKARKVLLRAADLIGGAVARPFRSRILDETPRRILVIEPWHIGDVVLTTPLLKALRESFPEARISLLGKAHAGEILGNSGLVDDFIIADLPWTRPIKKYPLKLAAIRQLRSLVRHLRNRRFDVTIDARMDIRSNILAGLTRAPVRVGFDVGGGGWLLTHSLPAERDAFHKIDDWLALYHLLPRAKPLTQQSRTPTLAISDAERDAARRQLLASSALSAPIIGYHGGGSHPGKRWPIGLFVELARELIRLVGGTHIFFLGPDDRAPDQLPPQVIVRRGSLREFMAEVSLCDLVICNDSGPMHIADALGVPLVAIFEIGNPQWYGPSRPGSVVIAGRLAGLGMSAAPVDTPAPTPVPLEEVKRAALRILAKSDKRVTATGQ